MRKVEHYCCTRNSLPSHKLLSGGFGGLLMKERGSAGGSQTGLPTGLPAGLLAGLSTAAPAPDSISAISSPDAPVLLMVLLVRIPDRLRRESPEQRRLLPVRFKCSLQRSLPRAVVCRICRVRCKGRQRFSAELSHCDRSAPLSSGRSTWAHATPERNSGRWVRCEVRALSGRV